MNLKFLIVPLLFGIAVATSACEPSVEEDTTVVIPETTSAENSENEPVAETPETQSVPGVQSQNDIRPEVLDKFVQAMSKSQQIQQKAEAKTWEAVENEGLSEEQFVNLTLALQDPTIDSASEFTDEEKQKFQQASVQVAKIQQEARENMAQAIEDEGLNPQHFNEIMIRVQQEPALMQEVQNRIASN